MAVSWWSRMWRKASRHVMRSRPSTWSSACRTRLPSRRDLGITARSSSAVDRRRCWRTTVRAPITCFRLQGPRGRRAACRSTRFFASEPGYASTTPRPRVRSSRTPRGSAGSKGSKRTRGRPSAGWIDVPDQTGRNQRSDSCVPTSTRLRRLLVRLNLALAALCLVTPLAPLAAQDRDQPDRTIDAAERRAVIDGVLDRLKQAYVFPDTAIAMERAVRARQRRGEYDHITSGRAFAESLTAHLQAVSRDLHLRVRHRAEPFPVEAEHDEPSPADRARARAFGQQVNFGFERVERLAGNVGYVEIRGFGFDTADVSEGAAAGFP